MKQNKSEFFEYVVNSIYKDRITIIAKSEEEASNNLHLVLEHYIEKAKENEAFAGVVIEKADIKVVKKDEEEILEDESVVEDIEDICPECGQHYDEYYGTCGDEECSNCKWMCKNCCQCTHPERKKV